MAAPPRLRGDGAEEPGSRLLVLLRHAQAETYAASDHERVLTDRGRRDATALGRWLADALGPGRRPAAAVVSDAARARETWELVTDAAGWRLAVQPQRAVYEAGTEALLDLLRGVDPRAGTVVVVGHNPTVGSLVHLLDDGTGDSGALAASVAGHPTAGAALLEVGTPWGDLRHAGAVLRAFHVGRG